MLKLMKSTKNQFLNAVKNKVLFVGPMATAKPPAYGPTIYVDGGSHWREPSTDAQISLGDGDSSTKELDLNFPAEKDTSDLYLALEMLPSPSLKIWLWGFLGGDKAHELINIGMVANWMDGRAPSVALFDQHLLIVSAGQWQIPISGGFSVITLQPNQITLKGCRYSLTEPTHLAPFSSLGLSNEANGNISVTCRRPLLIVARPSLVEQVLILKETQMEVTVKLKRLSINR